MAKKEEDGPHGPSLSECIGTIYRLSAARLRVGASQPLQAFRHQVGHLHAVLESPGDSRAKPEKCEEHCLCADL